MKTELGIKDTELAIALPTNSRRFDGNRKGISASENDETIISQTCFPTFELNKCNASSPAKLYLWKASSFASRVGAVIPHC